MGNEQIINVQRENVEQEIALDRELPEQQITVTPEIIEVYLFPFYNGNYEFTPSCEPQTIPIGEKIARQNITINPIPKCYGLISWSGLGIRVS